MDEEKKQEKEETTPLIHTFQSDANKFIKEKNISLADIALKEKIKYKDGFRDLGVKKNKTAYFVIPLIFIALVLAATVGYNKFLKNRSAQEKKETDLSDIRAGLPTGQAGAKPFIFSDETKSFEIGKGRILAKYIKDGLSKKYKKNGFIYALFTRDKKPIATDDFFNSLKISANNEFLKSLEKEFNINIHTDGEGKNNLIIVFKTNSFKTAYRAMLNLEKTILNNLSSILPEQIEKATQEVGLPVSPSSTELFLPSLDPASNKERDFTPEGFTDKIINNIDARVLENNGETILIYGFFSEKYLIITNSEEAFKKSLERLKISLNP